MIDKYEFEIYYGEIEEPLYLTNDKNYICDNMKDFMEELGIIMEEVCLLYTSPSPRDRTRSRMPSSA